MKNEKQFKLWVDALAHSTFNHKALIVEQGTMSYEEYLRLSKNATLIWISGHGDPYGVNLLGWNFDSNHTGDSEGKIFIFESCSVGQIWKVDNPLTLNLLGNGSLAVVASIDMGGVSYLPAEFWFFQLFHWKARPDNQRLLCQGRGKTQGYPFWRPCIEGWG
ncbi:hypothetical protein TBCH5v1_2193 [Thermococcus barophilus]|uniref:Gingipain domain-containing protein n=1 Tax=Thermococcus barophilus TaxID=55802 RepID=A0A0S1XE79_THEBA|nr:hypothetical protein TBCH5v1_2193 [Thermococcus barophilus]